MTNTEMRGRSPRLVTAGMIALTSALTFAALLVQDLTGFENLDFNELPWGLIIRYMITMGLGGAVAGLLLSGLFGRKGPGGWLIALIGGVLATLLAGLLGSLLGVVPDLVSGTVPSGALVSVLAGALVPVFAFAGRPLLLLSWVILIMATHLLAKRRRVAPD